MPKAPSVRDSLSLPVLAGILSDHVCEAEDPDAAESVLTFGTDLVRQSSSAADYRRFIASVRDSLQEVVSTTDDRTRASNAARAIELLERAPVMQQPACASASPDLAHVTSPSRESLNRTAPGGTIEAMRRRPQPALLRFFICAAIGGGLAIAIWWWLG